MEQRTRSAAPTPAGTVVDVPRLAGGLVADQRTGLVVVGTHHPGRLLLLDGRTGAVVSRLPLQGNPGQLALAAVRDTRSPDGSAIWSSPSASWVGTSSGPPAGERPTHLVTDRRDRLVVVDTGGNQLVIFQTLPRLTLSQRLPLPGTPYAVAYDPARDIAWVTLTATNEVAGVVGHRVRLAHGGQPSDHPGRWVAEVDPGHLVGGGKRHPGNVTGGVVGHGVRRTGQRQPLAQRQPGQGLEDHQLVAAGVHDDQPVPSIGDQVRRTLPGRRAGCLAQRRGVVDVQVAGA